MTVPETTYQIVVLVVLVLPGVVYATVRSAVRGFRRHEQGLSARLLQAAVVGAVLNAVYLLILGDWFVRQIRGAQGAVEQPRLLAFAVLILSVAVPAGLAFVQYGNPRLRRIAGRRWLRWVRIPQATTGYEATPTAWDKAVTTRGGCWVRIRVAEGKWVGGWYGSDSFVSTYPEPRDIFIESQRHIDENGVFGQKVEGTAGVWVALKEGDIVEWIRP